MNIKFVLNVSFYGAIALSGPRPPHYGGFTITLTFGVLIKMFK